MYRGWQSALVAALPWLWSLGLAAPVRADELYDVGATPVLNVHVTRGKVTIQTWDRQQVQISSDKPVDVQHLDAATVDSRMPRQISVASQSINTVHGPVTLPAESFVLPELPGTEHDAIVARGSGRVTITVPRSTAMIIAHVRAGHLNLNDYHGVFIAHVRSASISLNNVNGTGFVESLRGAISATNSSFDRLRVRSATGDINFKGCTSQQIQATSAYGSIVYDNGNFQPGLARFESEHGNVAVGVRGGAQIGGHSGSGQVISSFANGAQVRGDPTTKQATVGGGGPVVTATSKNGSVYLYSGSMTTHPHIQQELNGSARLPMQTFARPAAPMQTIKAPPIKAPPPRPPYQRQTRIHRRPR